MVELVFGKNNGLIPVIAQDWETNEVLMMAYMNEASFEETLRSGMATYYSRSRQELWKKGETSGNLQKVKEIRVDCDQDTLLLKVEQVGGAACHLGYKSCFFRILEKDRSLQITHEQIFDPKKVYK